MISPATYREYHPGPALAGLVECIWTSTISRSHAEPVEHRVLPDGCMDIIFDFSTAVGHRAAIVGTMSSPLIFSSTGAVDIMGVRFNPGGLSRIVLMDAAELTNSQTGLEDFIGAAANELWHRLAESTTTGRIRILRNYLTGRLRSDTRSDPCMMHCIDKIVSSAGRVPLGELERTSGYGARQLERKFSLHIGIGPKAFARIIRFKAILDAASQSARPDWAELAAEYAFADQSHLVREFREFSGLTPTAYLRGNPGHGAV